MEKFSKYEFSGINIKKVTAMKFRTLSKSLGMSNTETLSAMLDFFEIHQLSPMDSIDGSLSAIEIRIKRRIGNAIAIIRDIEKSQTLPTVAMLQSLFDQQFEPDNDDGDLDEDFEFIEKKFENLENTEEWIEETTVPKIRYERLEEKMEALKIDFGHVLEQVKEVRASFGKNYLKLELSLDELEKYKRTIKNS